MEYVDVVNENDDVIGKATREECHKNNKLIHRGINIIILNSKGEILLQKRSKEKDLYPGYWSSSVLGHVKSGQTYEEAAKEEMKEELGIEDVKLKHICNYKERTDIENHNMRLFEAKYDGPIKFNQEEVEKIIFVSKDELKKLLKTERFTACSLIGFKKYFELRK